MAAQKSIPQMLSCWKEIATYMGKGIRTVQRWEQEFNFPVHRPLSSGIVIAYPAELDGWFHRRSIAGGLP